MIVIKNGNFVPEIFRRFFRRFYDFQKSSRSMKIRDIYYGKSYSNSHVFPLISTIYENRKIFEKIFEKSPGRSYRFLVLSNATQNRTLFFTTRSSGNQNRSSTSKISSSACTVLPSLHFLTTYYSFCSLRYL